MGNAVKAAPARFDKPSQQRRSMIAKIQIARTQLAIQEDDYRQMLMDTTGQMSLTKCSDAQLARMIEFLKSRGFRPIQQKGNAGIAQHPMARKARALWISLHHLGVVRSAHEGALEAFAKRQLGCDKLIWARQSDAYRLIEALKNMGERNGWAMSDHMDKPFGPIGLQQSLCKAILARLKREANIPEDWSLDIAAYRLCGIDTACETAYTAQQYQDLAEALGKKLRELAPVRGGQE
ncbi:MAG: regulatory protein GemA [Pseudomonadota bacterium]|nr:regulatory protein GemA [Pseudomonadota bacterium]